MVDDDFDFFLTGLAKQEVLIPAIRRALYDPDFKGFNVPVDAFAPRPYDGWFHPSTHATWTVRQMYMYLVAHETLEEERMPMTGVLAVTAGKFWHEFLQRVLLQTKDLVRAEWPIRDHFTNRTGHVDGLLANGEALEIKTINPFQISKVVTEAVLKEKKPEYWGQTQDYLDILGLSTMRYLMINPSYPFEMAEFPVLADAVYQKNRRLEYRQAIELAEAYPDYRALDQGAPIPSCCAPKSAQAKQCPARNGCPVGRIGR